MTTSSIAFQWTALTVVAAMVVFVATIIASYYAWRRSGFRTSVGALELLRLALVALGGVLLNQPEFTQEFRPDDKPTLVVLTDTSPSMLTHDVTDKGTRDRVARSEAVSAFQSDEPWQSLGERMEIAIDTFGSETSRTDLSAPLMEALTQRPRLIAAVVASDGDWNEGDPPVEMATRYRLRGIPIYTVPVGSPVRLPDVELVSLDAPTFGVREKAVRIPFTIDSSLPREQMVRVTLRASDGEEVTKEVALTPMGRTRDVMVWHPREAGDFTVTVDVGRLPAETDPENNVKTAPVSIRDESLRVLVVESYPRWEYRYLRNALSRDPGVNLSCLLFHPGLGKVGGGNADYIRAFPAGLEELSEFDVIFLGDVGIDDEQLTDEQCRLLKGVVQHQASGLVFMPGWQGRQNSLLATELNDLYPVVLDPSQPNGWGARTPSHFELTQAGQRSLLTKLADTDDENLGVWESLPGFQWHAPVERARPGTEVLCVHRDAANQFGRLPLLVTRSFGTGKVLFMGTDGAWRWRKGVEDKYHYRFWGQVVRWMAYQRNMAKGETMRLYYAPDQPQLEQTLSLFANVMEASGNPLSHGEVTAHIVDPSGTPQTVQFQSTGDEWGAFSATFTPNQPGRHEVTLACKETQQSLEASFFVQGSREERPGQRARPEIMEELARVSRGEMVERGDIEKVVQALRALPDPPPLTRRIQLWSHPATGTLFVAGLTLFWVGRKVVGLI